MPSGKNHIRNGFEEYKYFLETYLLPIIGINVTKMLDHYKVLRRPVRDIMVFQKVFNYTDMQTLSHMEKRLIMDDFPFSVDHHRSFFHIKAKM